MPLHETMQATMFSDHFSARAQPQVKGIAQHDLRAHLDKFVRHHGLDGAVGAHGHKDRGLDHTVIERHAPASCQAVGGE